MDGRSHSHNGVRGCKPPHDREPPPDPLPRAVLPGWSAEQVYHAYYPQVRCLALRLLRNETDAEDVAQEVLLKVVRKLHTFRGDASLSTWLHRVTVNAVLRLRRRRTLWREQRLA